MLTGIRTVTVRKRTPRKVLAAQRPQVRTDSGGEANLTMSNRRAPRWIESLQRQLKARRPPRWPNDLGAAAGRRRSAEDIPMVGRSLGLRAE